MSAPASAFPAANCSPFRPFSRGVIGGDSPKGSSSFRPPTSCLHQGPHRGPNLIRTKFLHKSLNSFSPSLCLRGSGKRAFLVCLRSWRGSVPLPFHCLRKPIPPFTVESRGDKICHLWLLPDSRSWLCFWGAQLAQPHPMLSTHFGLLRRPAWISG